MSTRKIREPETSRPAANDEMDVLQAVQKLEALVEAAQHFDETRAPDNDVTASGHLTTVLDLIEDQCDALRVALWGEERSP